MNKKIKVKYNKYSCIIADSSILHQSITKKNSKPRLSMDIGVIPKKIKLSNYSFHKNHVPFDNINQIGNKKILVYKDSIKKRIKKMKSGTRTQSNRELIAY